MGAAPCRVRQAGLASLQCHVSVQSVHESASSVSGALGMASGLMVLASGSMSASLAMVATLGTAEARGATHAHGIAIKKQMCVVHDDHLGAR